LHNQTSKQETQEENITINNITIESEDESNDSNYTDGDQSDNMSILTDESAEKTVDSEELTQSKEYINPDAQPLIPSLDISALLARLNAAKYKEASKEFASLIV
jgi:hypothetical protein